MEDIQIDSAMTTEEMLLQNPAMLAPEEIINNLEPIIVTYYGFDNKIHQGQIVVHKKAVATVQKFFNLSMLLKFPINKVIPIASPSYAWDDNNSCDDNNSSGYNFRYISGTKNMSKHAVGLAFDINPAQNPYIKYNEKLEEIFRAPTYSKFDPETPGTLHASHPLVIMLKNEGWVWGGDWTENSGRIDYQHFELSL